MPEALSSGDSYVFHYKGNNNPPSKYHDIYIAIYALQNVLEHFWTHCSSLFTTHVVPRKQLRSNRWIYPKNIIENWNDWSDLVTAFATHIIDR